MHSDKKAKVARVLGFVCLGAAAVTGLVVVASLVSGRAVELPLVASGLGAFTMGIIMLAQARRRSPPDGEGGSAA